MSTPLREQCLLETYEKGTRTRALALDRPSYQMYSYVPPFHSGVILTQFRGKVNTPDPCSLDSNHIFM